MSQKPCLPLSRRRKRYDDKSLAAAPMITVDDIQEMDADAFLHRVVTQAETLPETPTAAEEPRKSKKRVRPGDLDDNVVVTGSAACVAFLVSHQSVQLHAAPTAACSRAWVYDTVLPSFERLRQYLESYHVLGVGSKTSRQRVPVPAMKDRAGWAQFCCGIVATTEDGADTDVEDGNAAASSAPWKTTLPLATGFHAPTVSLLLQLDQVLVRRVMVHLVDELVVADPSQQTTTAKLLEWIYGLLARLEQPVHRDDAVVLYKLLQHLTRVRSQQHAVLSDAAKAGINLLVAIVGIFFGQGGGYEQLMVPPLAEG